MAPSSIASAPGWRLRVCAILVCAGARLAGAAGAARAEVSFSSLAWGFAMGEGDVALVDLTGDGPMWPEVVITQTDGGSIWYGPNHGYSPLSFFSNGFTVGYAPRMLAIGDVTGDGRDDIVIANAGDPSLLVLPNGGSLALSLRLSTWLDFTPGPFALGDLDGDGHLDVAVVDAADTAIVVFAGDGSGRFSNPVRLHASDVPCDVAVGRLRGNAGPDIVARGLGRSSIDVFPNLGRGVFGPPLSWPSASLAGVGIHSLELGDVDGDGRLDVVVANGGAFLPHSFSVLRNRGGGVLAPSVDYGARPGATALLLADLEGDGHLDVAVLDQAAAVVSVFRNLGDGTFDAGTDVAAGANPVAFAAGDVVGQDGRLDLVVLDAFAPQCITMLVNVGATPRLAVAPEAAAGALRLLAPRPDPAPGATSIALALGSAATVDVAIYDLAGREVRALARGARLAAGPHAFAWDGRDAAGAPAPGGVYLVRASDGAAQATRKLVVTR